MSIVVPQETKYDSGTPDKRRERRKHRIDPDLPD